LASPLLIKHRDMDNVQKAIAAQRKRRSDIQSSYESKKKSAIEARKSSLLPKKTTTLGAGTGFGAMKYAAENYQSTDIKQKARITSQRTRDDLLAKARSEESKMAPVKAAPKGPSIAKKRAAFTAANAPVSTKATSPGISGIGVAGLSKAAPKGPSIAPARSYTDKEKQINALLMTGKKNNGTLKASAQRKIQRIRKK
jgi:hypothetical protein